MATCPSCSREVPEGNRFCGSCGSPIETTTSAPTWTSPGDTPHSSLDKDRFIPGTVLARLYRIISMLGRGGMGEVYRADDLNLGQKV